MSGARHLPPCFGPQDGGFAAANAATASANAPQLAATAAAALPDVPSAVGAAVPPSLNSVRAPPTALAVPEDATADHPLSAAATPPDPAAPPLSSASWLETICSAPFVGSALHACARADGVGFDSLCR